MLNFTMIQVVGVVVDGVTIDANVVVIAMGPWSGVAASFFPGSGLPKITGTRAHSIIMDVKVLIRLPFVQTANSTYTQ